MVFEVGDFVWVEDVGVYVYEVGLVGGVGED